MSLFHITTRTAWAEAQAQGEYRPPSLENEGFIHLSGDRQWQVAGNRFYRRASDLVLLTMPSRTAPLAAEVRSEEADGDSYPHLYGPLNIDAVAEVHPLALGERGLFEVPEGLAPWRAMFLPPPHRLPLDPVLEALIMAADPAIAAVVHCALPEGYGMVPVLCAETRPGHRGGLSLKDVSEALELAGADLALRQSDLLQLPSLPRRPDGTLDEPALWASLEGMLGISPPPR